MSPEAVNEFRSLFLQKFGIELSEEAATQQASDLINLYRVVFTASLQMKIKNEYEPERLPNE